MKIKRILLIALMAVMVIASSMNFVYAENSFSVNITTDKQNYAAGQYVEVTVSISNRKIGALIGKLTWNPDVFETIPTKTTAIGDVVSDDITPLNGWSRPTFNNETGEFVTLCGDDAEGTGAQNIMKIRLKLKEGAQLGKVDIMLDNLVGSIGDTEEISTTPATAKVEIKNASDIGGTTIPVVTTPSPRPTSSPSAVNSPKVTPSNLPSKLPQTGISDNPAPILFGALIVTLISYVVYRRYKEI